MKLIMTKGLPGSGKTRWAQQYLEENPNTVLVCKDDLRAMMFNSAWTGKREKTILAVRDFIIIQALHEGKNVVVHDTNFAPKHEERFKQIAKEHKAEFEIKDFTDVPIEQCIHNDLCREASVGEKVIRQMWKEWLRPEVPFIQYDPTLQDAIICDLDGTLALFGDANPYDRDFLKDEVNEVVKGILLSCGKPGVQILFVSGRKDIFRKETTEWLNKNWGTNYKLFMRKTAPEGEQEPKDVLVKQGIYEQEIKGKYNVLFVLDDRNQVVDFWRSQGLTCLQVAEGDF